MKFYKNLYISDSIKKSPFRIKYTISRRPIRSNYYVIALATNSDQLDMFHSRYLIQPYYKKHIPYIIGVAKDREDAILLSKKIVEEIYDKTKSADVKSFFRKTIE